MAHGVLRRGAFRTVLGVGRRGGAGGEREGGVSFTSDITLNLYNLPTFPMSCARRGAFWLGAEPSGAQLVDVPAASSSPGSLA